jgi:hypothetical protein
MFFASAPRARTAKCPGGFCLDAERLQPLLLLILGGAAPSGTADGLSPREIRASNRSSNLPRGGLLVDPDLPFSIVAKRVEVRLERPC